ncbi:acyloxyacyl hydrolase [Maribrevibacterium harenarium]|uniref:Acyloxyacyl hydrolase n=1 Tax=Maribrevibacterium harenarium TaxID=2589817 RepID=A0A501WT25_9GAMM|nr:acyloxyacyl hydrolase [Maribrevibacterium harenarium]TPE51992.1 acyloxyacyl hydrolase [Maribrevibacterium harenarium]
MLIKKQLSTSFWKKFKRGLWLLCLSVAGILPVTGAVANETATWRTTMALTTAAVYLTNALNADTMSVELGGTDNIGFLRYSARWYREHASRIGNSSWQIQPALQIGYSKWQGSDDLSQKNTNNVFDVLPVFRWSTSRAPKLFVDTGVGLSLFSSEYITQREFGGTLQFNNYLGIGTTFGNDKWEASANFQHYSNNNLYDKNTGVNFWFLSISHRY